MRTISVAAILAALTMPALSADLTPSAFRAMLDGQNAATVLRSLDQGAWNAFLAHVEAGERGWIDLVPMLAGVTDAEMSKGLVATLSRALRSNPQGVLSALAADQYAVSDICGDNNPGATPLEAVHFIDEALVKVAAVIDPDLSGPRNACLHELGAARISALI